MTCGGKGMSFVRRTEFGVAMAVLLFLILFCLSKDTPRVVAHPIPSPPPRVTYIPNPQPIVQQPPRPRPCYVVRRYHYRRWCGWRRPNYVCGQPVRNLLRFLWLPNRWRC